MVFRTNSINLVTKMLNPHRPPRARFLWASFCVLLGLTVWACQSSAVRFDKLLSQGLYLQARQVLEENGAGAIPTAKVAAKDLEARMRFAESVQEDCRKKLLQMEERGECKAALSQVEKSFSLCPWSDYLEAEKQRLTEVSRELSTLRNRWVTNWDNTGDPDEVDPRPICKSLLGVSNCLGDSPDLARVLAEAQKQLIQGWEGELVKAKGILAKSDVDLLGSELRELAGLGDSVTRLTNVLTKLRNLSLAPNGDLKSRLDDSLDLFLEVDFHKSNVGEDADFLAGVYRSLDDGLRTYLVGVVFPRLIGGAVEFEHLALAEDLLAASGGDPRFAVPVSEAHLVRAEMYSHGGVVCLLGWGHLQRAQALGISPTDDRWLDLSRSIRAGIEAATLPQLRIALAVSPNVEPKWQALILTALRREIEDRCVGLTELVWQDPNNGVHDILIEVGDFKFVQKTTSSLRSVRSKYLSHFQDVPNARKSRLKSQLGWAEIAVGSAESAYESAIRSYNINPSGWRLTTANSKYSNYKRELDSYNYKVRQYNSTPSTVSEPVYLPYQYQKGVVEFGWRCELEAVARERKERLSSHSLDKQKVRVGTKTTDKSSARRRDVPSKLDFSIDNALVHLSVVVGELCDGLGPLLVVKQVNEYSQLTKVEEAALKWALHPWGSASRPKMNSAVPDWMASYLAMYQPKKRAQIPPLIKLTDSSGSKPPAHGSAQELSDWYGPIVCEIQSFNGGKQISHGSGVLVSGDGLILTCAHVLNAPTLKARFHEGGLKGTYELTPVFVNQARDVAVLRAEAIVSEVWAPVRLSSGGQRGEEIIAVGNPTVGTVGTGFGSVSRGVVSNPSVDQGRGHYLVGDISVASGSSGGPLIAISDGAIVGIVQAVLEGGVRADAIGGGSSSGFSCLAAPAEMLSKWVGLSK